MTENARPNYLWSVACAWGLTTAVAVLTVSGVLAKFLPAQSAAGAPLRVICVLAFACVAALAIANANNAAGAAQHAASHPAGINWPILIPATLCAFGFAGASLIGIDLGWNVMAHGASPTDMPETGHVLAAGGFLGLAKIAMSWIIEGRRSMDKADAAVADAAHREELSAIRAADRARPSATARPTLATENGVALASATAMAVTPSMALGAPPSAHHDPNAERSAIVSTNIGYASARAHALALASAHPDWTQERIAREIGGKRSTVGKWLRASAA